MQFKGSKVCFEIQKILILMIILNQHRQKKYLRHSVQQSKIKQVSHLAKYLLWSNLFNKMFWLLSIGLLLGGCVSWSLQEQIVLRGSVRSGSGLSPEWRQNSSSLYIKFWSWTFNVPGFPAPMAFRKCITLICIWTFKRRKTGITWKK